MIVENLWALLSRTSNSWTLSSLESWVCNSLLENILNLSFIEYPLQSQPKAFLISSITHCSSPVRLHEKEQMSILSRFPPDQMNILHFVVKQKNGTNLLQSRSFSSLSCSFACTLDWTVKFPRLSAFIFGHRVRLPLHFSQHKQAAPSSVLKCFWILRKPFSICPSSTIEFSLNRSSRT